MHHEKVGVIGTALSYLAVERALIPFGGEAQKNKNKKQLSYLSVERRKKNKNKKQLSYLSVERRKKTKEKQLSYLSVER